MNSKAFQLLVLGCEDLGDGYYLRTLDDGRVVVIGNDDNVGLYASRQAWFDGAEPLACEFMV